MSGEPGREEVEVPPLGTNSGVSGVNILALGFSLKVCTFLQDA